MLPLPQKTLEPLLLQHVVVPGAAALEPALLAYLEAPGSALVGLHLRHQSSTFRLFLPAKKLAAREKGRFASVFRQASVSNCCLSASGPLPVPVRLGGLGLGRLFSRGHDHYHVAPVEVGLALYAPEFVEVLS